MKGEKTLQDMMMVVMVLPEVRVMLVTTAMSTTKTLIIMTTIMIKLITTNDCRLIPMYEI